MLEKYTLKHYGCNHVTRVIQTTLEWEIQRAMTFLDTNASVDDYRDAFRSGFLDLLKSKNTGSPRVGLRYYYLLGRQFAEYVQSQEDVNPDISCEAALVLFGARVHDIFLKLN
jgi:hypothetical protein